MTSNTAVYIALSMTIGVLALISIIPTVLFRKKMELPILIALLTVELTIVVISGIFLLCLGFFYR